MDVLIGSSSQDIRLEDSFHIIDSTWLDGKERGFYAKAQVTNA